MGRHYETADWDINTQSTDGTGDVTFTRKFEGDDCVALGKSFTVPFSTLKMLVADYVRNNRISALEGADDESILFDVLDGCTRH